VPLAPGDRVSTYEVTALIGSGGMGQVYRARDTKLKRDVALKILPDEFSLDAERLTRFEREAELLASLNHPSIGGIYGFEKAGGTYALVLELVEGETLADVIARGLNGLPVRDALEFATQMAGALEAAHEKGIVHRDLKPANVKITPDGNVKVLDFGLAKALTPDRSGIAITHSPTLTLQATSAGVILGTAAYMSPEQARGRVVDKRTDIFSFGAVLYEMLVGRRAFPGETITEVLACVIEREPDWSALPPLDPRLGELLRRCLEKDPGKRRRDMGDVRLEIERALGEPTPAVSAPPAAAASRSSRLAWVVASAMTVIAAIATVATVALYRRAPDRPAEMRLDIETPSTSSPNSFALSPDGQRAAFVAAGDGQPRLWVRSLNSTTVQPLQGTEGATYPFWSPDGRSIGFFAAGKLKRLDLAGGLPQVLADAPNGRGGTWGDGTILFSTTGSAVKRVSASGGDVTFATTIAGHILNHRFPVFLPDHRQFLFSAQGSPEEHGIYLGSLDAPGIKRLVADDSAAASLPGWLIYVRQGTLIGRRFDMARAEVSGDPVTIANLDVPEFGFGAFSISTSGLIAYRAVGTSHSQLTWFDRSGRVISEAGAVDANALSHPEVSPDGRRIAVDRSVQGNTDVWIMEGARSTRVTFDAGVDHAAIWSPDGNRLAFDSSRTNTPGHQFFWKPSSGAGGDEQLIATIPGDKGLNDWSADGKYILYAAQDPKNAYDLWVLPLDGDRKPRLFLSTSFTEQQGRFSKDGRWIAYQSNESGQFEIYVRPFPGPGGQWQISTAGGITPRWRRDGRELYFISPDGQLMAASVSSAGTTFASEAPVALFRTRILEGGSPGDFRGQYDVAPDGRFLINTIADESVAPIRLLLNWNAPR